MLPIIFDQVTLAWVVIPFLIFCARIADVSFGTIRVIFISKGLKQIAPLIGFFEILIWLFAIGQIMQNLNNWLSIIAYAGGFATGTFVGMAIEERLSFGEILVRIISKHNVPKILAKLKEKGYKITCINADGEKGEVKMLLTITHRKNIPAIITIIKNINPDAFYTIEDIKSVSDDHPKQKKSFSLKRLAMFPAFKKGK